MQAASTAQEGLRMARDLRPVAIVLDLVLPDRDGSSVLAELQETPDVQDIPVIVLSMLNKPDGSEALGAAEYLTKPLDRGQFSAILDRYRATV